MTAMAELHDLIRFRDQLRSSVVGAHVRRVIDTDHRLRGITVRGVRAWLEQDPVIAAVDQRGMYLLLGFMPAGAVVFAPKYRGGICVGADVPHARLIIRTDKGDVVFFDAAVKRGGHAEWYPSWDELVVRGPHRRCGVPVSSALFTTEWLIAKMRRKRVSIVNCMLDQKIFAGFGNELRCEALWISRVAPHKMAQSLEHGEVARLREACSVACFRAGTKRSVYGRGGQPCVRCSGTITRDIIQGWPVFWCKACQQ